MNLTSLIYATHIDSSLDHGLMIFIYKLCSESNFAWMYEIRLHSRPWPPIVNLTSAGCMKYNDFNLDHGLLL